MDMDRDNGYFGYQAMHRALCMRHKEWMFFAQYKVPKSELQDSNGHLGENSSSCSKCT